VIKIEHADKQICGILPEFANARNWVIIRPALSNPVGFTTIKTLSCAGGGTETQGLKKI
jgi:hypothetical protein